MTKKLCGAGLLLCLLVIIGVQSFANDFDGGTSGSVSFPAVCGQYPGVLVESSSIAVTNIAEPVPIAVINGEYSINGGAYTAEPALVSYGQTVSVRHVAASGDETMKSTVLTIGGMSATFTSSTEPCLRGTR
jgi:hypothetical protein